MSAAPEHQGPTIEEEILELWFEGFDTALISKLLTHKAKWTNAPAITEATVANIVAAEMDRRHAARTAFLTTGARL